jgi:integrase
MTGRLVERNGKYQAVLYFKDKDKKEKQIWRSTGYDIKGNKRKAEAYLEELKEQFAHLEYREPCRSDENNNQLLFTEVIRQWLERKKNKVALSTYEGLTIYVNKHIVPYFEKLNLIVDEVTPKHIYDYYDYKFNSGRCDNKTGGLNIQSIKKHSMILKQVFGEAVVAEQIVRNPASGVPLPRQENLEIKGIFLTGSEANIMLKAFDGHPLQPLVYVTLYYALRRSEALGLRWSAVDFENNTIRIEHTVVKNLSVEYKDKTKTKTSKGSFHLLKDVREVFLKLKELRDTNRRKFGSAYNESDYIFTWENGKLYTPDYITRTFQRVLKKHGLPVMRFHDLRHSTAGILHDKGWDLKDIQEWLRHADIETTGNIYTHVSVLRKQSNAKNLENTFTITHQT